MRKPNEVTSMFTSTKPVNLCGQQNAVIISDQVDAQLEQKDLFGVSQHSANRRGTPK